MQSETHADFAPLFDAPTIDAATFEAAADAAHSSYRTRESFETRLKTFAATASSPEQHLRAGLGYLALSKFNDALEHLAKAKDSPLRYLSAAEALTAQGKFENARNALAAAAQHGADAFACDMGTAVLFIREGDLDAAGKLIKKHEGRGADRGEWYHAAALLAEANFERPRAYELHQKAVTLSSDKSHILFGAAYLYDLVGEEHEAIQLYERLARRPRAYVNALVNMAVIYEDNNRYDEAADCLRRVLKAFPNHRRAQLFLKDVESGIEMVADEGRPTAVDPRQRLLDSAIVDFELSVRARNCLKKMNVRTIGDLIKLSEPELMAYKNFGETSLSEIRALLEKKGLRLGMSPDEIDPSALVAATEAAPAAPEAPKIEVPPEKQAVLSKPVSDLELSVRSRRCLQRLNVQTIGDLVNYSESDLLSTRNFGQTSLTEIRGKLGELGLELRAKK